MEKERCQSCGMPLGTAGYYGTNKDESENKNYCIFCYKKGQYTEPILTLPEMIQKSIQHMTTKLQYTQENAKELSTKIIPTLKRWTEKPYIIILNREECIGAGACEASDPENWTMNKDGRINLKESTQEKEPVHTREITEEEYERFKKEAIGCPVNA